MDVRFKEPILRQRASFNEVDLREAKDRVEHFIGIRLREDHNRLDCFQVLGAQRQQEMHKRVMHSEDDDMVHDFETIAEIRVFEVTELLFLGDPVIIRTAPIHAE